MGQYDFLVRKHPEHGWLAQLPVMPTEVSIGTTVDGSATKAAITVRYGKEHLPTVQRLLEAMDRAQEEPEVTFYVKRGGHVITMPPLFIVFMLKNASDEVLAACFNSEELEEVKRKTRGKPVGIVTFVDKSFKLLDVGGNAAAARFFENYRRRKSYLLRVALGTRGGDEVVWEHEVE